MRIRSCDKLDAGATPEEQSQFSGSLQSVVGSRLERQLCETKPIRLPQARKAIPKARGFEAATRRRDKRAKQSQFATSESSGTQRGGACEDRWSATTDPARGAKA